MVNQEETRTQYIDEAETNSERKSSPINSKQNKITLSAILNQKKTDHKSEDDELEYRPQKSFRPSQAPISKV